MTEEVQTLTTVATPAFLAELSPFVIFPIEIVSTLTLIPFDIIS